MMPLDQDRNLQSDDSYFTWRRDDILAVVPASAQTVLSVGCGAGVTEAELVKRGLEVLGVELNHSAAEQARARGLTIIDGDATQVIAQLHGRAFDCLIYADVLEHIPDPLALLRMHVASLKPGGHIIISVPNFRHYRVFWQLFVCGHITYTDAGILDKTHLRITTRRGVEEWLGELGMEVVAVNYGMSQRREQYLSLLSLGLAREFLARNVVLVGKKNGQKRYG